MSQAGIRITFVRHGESVSNRAQRWQGQGDSELSELGRSQAEALGQRIGGRHFDRVIASDLTRAVDTARATGFRFERDRTFREFDVGRWEGLTREEVEARYPEEIERLKEGEDIPLGGGESYAAFSERIDGALARLRAQLEPGQHALVVCHGGVIGTAIAGLMGLRGSGRWPLSRVTNTAISELTWHVDGAATLRVFNDARHIAGVSPWPVSDRGAGCVGLVSEREPHAAFGSFEAHYEAEHSLRELEDGPHEGPAARLVALLKRLGARHPAHRVSLSAPASLIHAWAVSALWKGVDAAARLALPSAGSLAHVGQLDGHTVLLDYGVAAD